jgi:hypothetical protein
MACIPEVSNRANALDLHCHRLLYDAPLISSGHRNAEAFLEGRPQI